MKNMILLKMKYLLTKTDESIKHDKFVNNNWKGVISERNVFLLVCSKYLSSWTGLGRSGHDQIKVLTGPDMTKSRLLVQFRTFRVQN